MADYRKPNGAPVKRSPTFTLADEQPAKPVAVTKTYSEEELFSAFVGGTRLPKPIASIDAAFKHWKMCNIK